MPGGAAPLPPASLSVTVAEVCTQLRPKAERDGVVLGYEVDAGPGRTAGPAPLREALFNLVDNAIDAAATAVRVTVRHDGRSPEGPEGPGGIAIAVADDGPGVAPAVEHDLYEPFVTTKPDGTGMGLAVADAIAAELGGRLHHEPHGPGTRFVLALPATPMRSELPIQP